jgi:hypothetical protein
MECQECEELERRFVEVRTDMRNMRQLGAGALDDSERQELKALHRLLDHRMEHRCQRAGE